MALQFSEPAEQRFQEVLARYPEESRRAALLPTLYIAQDDFDYLSVEVMEYVAGRLSLPASKVLAVATFYTMYNKRPVGRYHFQVCVSVSCAIMGAHKLVHILEKKLGVRLGETDRPRTFTLSEVECLASCGTAPMLQLDDPSGSRYIENLVTVEDIDRVLDPIIEQARRETAESAS